MKEVHYSNIARSANARIITSFNVVIGIRSILFELKDRQLCDALPDATILNEIDDGQVNITRRLRRSALDDMASRKDVKLPYMKVPKLTNTNFEDSNTEFSSVFGRQYSLADVTLNYLLRDKDVGDYNFAWSSRDEKIKNCISLNGTSYKYDKEGLYSLAVEHIGTDVCGSIIIIKHKRSKDGKKFYIELRSHFQNDSHKQNLSTAANKAIGDKRYHGERRTFTLETYYTIMSKNFNILEQAGVDHTLTEEQKVIKFET